MNIKKLHALASLEATSASFWDKLSDKEKKAYIKAHPGSKYARAPQKTVKSPAKKSTSHTLIRARWPWDDGGEYHQPGKVDTLAKKHGGYVAAPADEDGSGDFTMDVHIPSHRVKDFRNDMRKYKIKHEIHPWSDDFDF